MSAAGPTRGSAPTSAAGPTRGSAPTSAPGPIRVAVIDASAPIVDLDCTRDCDPPYAAAWVLAYRDGRPLGSFELPLRGTRIPAEQLERELRVRFGDAAARERPTDTPSLGRASVVVPTAMSRPEQLRRCVRGLTALDHPDYEVIVVDNRPAGASPVELPGVRVVCEPRPGISAARNRGLAAATGEIVAFTDDDVEVDPGWLRALGERFARTPGIAAVTGLVVPAELETPAQIFFEQSGSGLDRGYRPLTFERAGRFQIKRRDLEDETERIHSLYETGELGLGSNMAFRAAVLRAAGGFDEALGTGTPTRGGEDLAILLELLTSGHRLAYEPGAVVHHTHRATIADLERQIHGYGVGFTAMLTAIALRDPRHFAGLASVVPRWLGSLRDPGSAKRAHRTADFPSDLGAAELRGMLAGPVAYLRARNVQRRWAA
jgi:GT2 family glycosyltransferase